MAVYIVTGEQGEGKGIMAMMQIQEALHAGKRVVTNIDLKLEHLVPHPLHRNVWRCSDFPSADELWSIGQGCEEYDQKKFGLIVLDEMGIYLNSRNFKDAGRDSFIKWLRHVRKMHWDLMILVQSAESLDKQIRNGLAHYHVKCKAGDKMTVPVLSPIVKFFTGRTVPLPKFHAGLVFRGFGPSQQRVDTWFTRGTSFYKCYDTGQLYTGEVQGLSTVLDTAKAPWLVRPQGWRENVRAFGWEIKQRCYWLWSLLPGWIADISPDLQRHLDFTACETLGPPRLTTDGFQSFNDWAASSAGISTAGALPYGVRRDLSGETCPPLQLAA